MSENKVRTFRMTDEEHGTVKKLLREIKQKTKQKTPAAMIAALRLYNKVVDGRPDDKNKG